jgi:chemotaxis protein MotB
MAYARARRRDGRQDIWPGFVDVLSTLLLVFVFLLTIFALVQFFLSREISGRDVLLNQLRAQIEELAETLALGRTENFDLANTVAILEANLAEAEADRDQLAGLLAVREAEAADAAGRAAALAGDLDAEQQLTQRALSQVEILNAQIAALRAQLAAIQQALDIAEAADAANQLVIEDLGARLNLALQERVEELSRYRSDFFGRLSEILGNREDIRIVGDRFVFQSEVLFAVGEAEIDEGGRAQLVTLAAAIRQLETEIPEDITWVLQVNGHTDAQPMQPGARFRSNWELSAARAISVVNLLIAEGVSPDRLAAAGYGEFQPLEAGDTPEIYARNRRIELKLTEG